MKILVTGGAGFVGSHIVNRFLSEGWEIIVIDSLEETSDLDRINPGERNRRIRTQRARQRLAFSRHKVADDLTEKISNYLDSISYNPDIIRRIKQEGQGQEEEINIYY